jgi:hypothetical protein
MRQRRRALSLRHFSLCVLQYLFCQLCVVVCGAIEDCHAVQRCQTAVMSSMQPPPDDPEWQAPDMEAEDYFYKYQEWQEARAKRQRLCLTRTAAV